MNSDKYDYFTELSGKTGKDILSLDFALYLDELDELRYLRNKFAIPKTKENTDVLYLNGNSLGLMPKDARLAVMAQFDKWESRGSLGHTEEPMPWIGCDEEMLGDMADIIGSNSNETAIMSQLTVNLHLMLVSFYKPTINRHKILCEDGLFPSDKFAFESQVEWHGYNPNESIIRLSARENEYTIRTEDILDIINNRGHEIALICFSGVQYLTGQFFNINKVTEAGHSKGCIVGWDLAHAVGNVPLYLHDWNVDFAVWCSYKYLNCGPGSVGGIFVHEKNLENQSIVHFRGWWGHRSSDRFKMTDGFKPENGALKYRLSNPSFSCCAIAKVSLKIFKDIGIVKLRKKSILLTNYFEYLLTQNLNDDLIEIITPKDVSERGSQLSLKIYSNVDIVETFLKKMNIFCDYREPSIFRMAPCALYNSFTDIYLVVNALKDVFRI